MTKDGGPFLRAWDEPNGLNYIVHPGITLRDQLALDCYNILLKKQGMQVTPEHLAADAYRYADAMLKERDK